MSRVTVMIIAIAIRAIAIAIAIAIQRELPLRNCPYYHLISQKAEKVLPISVTTITPSHAHDRFFAIAIAIAIAIVILLFMIVTLGIMMVNSFARTGRTPTVRKNLESELASTILRTTPGAGLKKEIRL